MLAGGPRSHHDRRRRSSRAAGPDRGGAFLPGLGAGRASRPSSPPARGTTAARPSRASAAPRSPTPPPSVRPSASADRRRRTPNQVVTGPLKFANWPAYIDLATAADATTGVLPAGLVADARGLQEEVQRRRRLRGEDRATTPPSSQTIQPALVGGLPTGWDLIVLTDWMAAKIITKGWAEQIDQANVPNCVANLRDPLQGPGLGPDNDYHYPWQSGMTGIGYNKKTLADEQHRRADQDSPTCGPSRPTR